MTTIPSISRSDFKTFIENCTPAHPLLTARSMPFVSSNTQARRLGCLLYLLNKIASGDRTERLLFATARKELPSLLQNLEHFSKSAGVLTQKVSSFRHYLELAESFSLVVRQGAAYQPSNDGVLLLRISPNEALEPYPLNRQTCVYLFQSIFIKDVIGVTPILRNLLENKQSSLQSIIADYSEAILRVLKEQLNESSSHTRLSVQTKIRDVKKWTNPTSYGEHLVSSKLNWLADLGIIHGPPNALTCQAEIFELFKELLTEPLLTISDVLFFSWKFALKNDDGGQIVPFEEAFRTIFSIAATDTTVSKIRVTDAIRLLLAYFPRTFELLTTSYGSLAAAIHDIDRGAYTVQAAQRQSQAYIFRLTKS